MSGTVMAKPQSESHQSLPTVRPGLAKKHRALLRKEALAAGHSCPGTQHCGRQPASSSSHGQSHDPVTRCHTVPHRHRSEKVVVCVSTHTQETFTQHRAGVSSHGTPEEKAGRGGSIISIWEDHCTRHAHSFSFMQGTLTGVPFPSGSVTRTFPYSCGLAIFLHRTCDFC